MSGDDHRSLKRRSLKALRRVGGERGAVEVGLRSARNFARYKAGRPISRTDLFVVRSGTGPRFGVYAYGGCDVGSVVTAGPALARRLGGTVCVHAYTKTAVVRSDLVLASLDPPQEEMTRDVIDRLGLDSDHFATTKLFDPTFEIRAQIGLGAFPKNVVVLSTSTDSSRSLYRHREHGFLVDPGGWWLHDKMESVLGDLDTVKWFAANFQKVGRLSVQDSMENLQRIVTNVREQTGAFVVVLNMLTVDPGRTAMDYKQANSPHRLRRREFVLALDELADRVGFAVMDIDRITKAEGISGQADFVHFTRDQKKAIAEEFVRILDDAGVLEGRRLVEAEAQ